VAVIDGILRIADQMGEAELVLLGVPQLRGQSVALTRALQQGHVARNNSMRVVTGLIGGMSI
jgi:hypothetical protein